MAVDGPTLRSLREQAKLHQSQIAAAAHVSRGYIAAIEVSAQPRNVSTVVAGRLARALGVRPEQLRARGSTAEVRNDWESSARLNRPGLAQEHELISWSQTMSARSELPRLIRRLVLESGNGILAASFPAGEGVDASGPDGLVTSGSATAFVPIGESVWELSVTHRPGPKAKEDYARHTPRADTTYVQVSLGEWRDHQTWAKEMTSRGEWKEVRAYDVHDLVAWLETAPATHVWLSELLDLHPFGLETLDSWWRRWSAETRPELPHALVLAGRDQETETLGRRLSGPPQVTTIRSNSVDEAIAFVAATIMTREAELPAVRARTIVLHEGLAAHVVRSQIGPLVILAASPDAAKDVSVSTAHHIVVPITDSRADIDLRPIDSEAATKALMDAGVAEQAARRTGELARISVHSARRHLARNPELVRPFWAERPVSKLLRRVLLLQRWSDTNEADREVAGKLTGMTYEQFANDLGIYERVADPFLTKVESVFSIVSPADAWELVRRELRREDLTAFADLAVDVLMTANPELELPPAERWRASLHDKTPKFSRALRRGLATTLALLGTYGDSNAGDLSLTDWATRIVHRVLTTANDDETGVAWASLEDVLPLLAEAAPDEFLSAAADAASGTTPLLRSMFADAEPTGLSVSSPHTGLLWALELSAWSTQHLGRALDVLARLARIDPGGKMANRPMSSLIAILRPWYPRTAASVPQRLAASDGLVRRHPVVGARLLTALLPQHLDAAHPTYEPQFRNWIPASTAVPPREYWEFVNGVVERLVALASHEPARWAAIIPHLETLGPARSGVLERLLALVPATFGAATDQKDVWEGLQALIARHRRAPNAQWVLPTAELIKLEQLEARLRPEDAAARLAFLFNDYWPQLPGRPPMRLDSVDDVHELESARAGAIVQVLGAASWPQLIEFATSVKVPDVIGTALVDAGLLQYEDALLESLGGERGPLKDVARGYVWKRAAGSGQAWIKGVLARPDATALVKARVLMSTTEVTAGAALAEHAGSDVLHAYWSEVLPLGLPPERVGWATEQLLAVGRVAQALDVLAMNLPKQDDREYAERVVAALEAQLARTTEDPEQPKLAEYDYWRLFDYLERSSIDRARVAQLEWPFLQVLDNGHEPRALHEQLAQDPNFFVDLIRLAFRPATPQPDADRSTEPKTALEASRARNAYRLLQSFETLPGLGPEGLDADHLRHWIEVARTRLAEEDRAAIGDDFIGRVLSSPGGTTGKEIWPAVPVRDLIEDLASSHVDLGFNVAVRNRRGVVTKSLLEGGTQERDLAAKYRAAAESFAAGWPRTAAIMRQLADEYEREARQEDEEAEQFRKGRY